MIINKYERPDVYYERDTSIVYAGEQTPVMSTPVFIGTTLRGVTTKPISVMNWNDFKSQASLGFETPFTSVSYLPHVMYDFYSNNGKKAYFVRVVGQNAKKAEAELTTGIKVQALDVGEWANNNLEVTVKLEEEPNENKDISIQVKFQGEEVELFENLTQQVDDARYYQYIINKYSNYINIPTISVTPVPLLTEVVITLINGDSDLSNITLEDYKNAMHLLDPHEDFGILAITDMHGIEIAKEVLEYCDTRKNVFPIIEGTLLDTPESIMQMKKQLPRKAGGLYYPWQLIVDPASKTEQTKYIPCCGGIIGNYVQTDRNRGVAKAPSGTTCVMTKAIDLKTNLSVSSRKDEVAMLTKAGINPIINKPKRGIVLWGSDSLSGNPISTDRLDMAIEMDCYDNTDWSIFEPASLDLCDQIKASLEDVLRDYFNAGAFKGRDEKSAFFVKCDEDINPSDQLDEGIVVAEIGYANVKPNKFTIIKVRRVVGQ